ncbi:hypothetical protein [Aurantivibrio infirmus]
MSTQNPYTTPTADIQNNDNFEFSERMEKMAGGQKLVIYAVLLYFIAASLRLVIGPFAFILLFISLIISLIGLYKVLSARQNHIAVKIILFALLFIPLINILVLLSINSRATKSLREAGYKVGFMGASKQTA